MTSRLCAKLSELANRQSESQSSVARCQNANNHVSPGAVCCFFVGVVSLLLLSVPSFCVSRYIFYCSHPFLYTLGLFLLLRGHCPPITHAVEGFIAVCSPSCVTLLSTMGIVSVMCSTAIMFECYIVCLIPTSIPMRSGCHSEIE